LLLYEYPMLLKKRIPVKYIFGKIKYNMLYALIVGIAIHYLSVYASHYIPVMPLSIPAFLGTAISVLLSFKMSQSYERWWEARKVWGAIVNDSRTFVVQLQAFIHDEGTIKKLAYRQIAWCYSLGQSLRGQAPIENLGAYFEGDDFANLNANSNKPLAIIQQNSNDIKELHQKGEIDTFTQIHLDKTLIRLVDSMGKAERINSTVFPTTYRLSLHYAIYLFITVLSIALDNIDIVYELPLLLAISVIFFMMEKTATHLQDPFMDRPSDTAVTTIARTIEINLKQLLKEKEIPEPLKTEGFYSL